MSADTGNPGGAAEALAAMRSDPARTCLITDFDGTLSAVVDDPAAARPLVGAPALLRSLAARFGRVAVVSGRPVSFLVEHLHLNPPVPPNLEVAGLYGLERLGAGGVEPAARAEPWREVIADAADRAEREGPPGLLVERKGMAVTLHWRRHPEVESWAEDFAVRTAQSLQLVVHPARRSVELRPPLEVDKGTVVASLAEGFAAVLYMGDDLGDLPAFVALDQLAEEGRAVLKVAVSSPEAPPALLAAADLAVAGPAAALAFLAQLWDENDAGR